MDDMRWEKYFLKSDGTGEPGERGNSGEGRETGDRSKQENQVIKEKQMWNANKVN